MEGVSLEPFHREENGGIFLNDLMDLYDMIVVDRSQRPGFAKEALISRRIVVERGLHHLESDPPPQVRILSQEDKGRAALTQQPEHAIIAQASQFVRLLGRTEESIGGRRCPKVGQAGPFRRVAFGG